MHWCHKQIRWCNNSFVSHLSRLSYRSMSVCFVGLMCTKFFFNDCNLSTPFFLSAIKTVKYLMTKIEIWDECIEFHIVYLSCLLLYVEFSSSFDPKLIPLFLWSRSIMMFWSCLCTMLPICLYSRDCKNFKPKLEAQNV